MRNNRNGYHVPHVDYDLQWKLYKATIELHGLLRQVDFQNRENKYELVKAVPSKQ